MTEKLATRMKDIDDRLDLMTPRELADAAGELVAAMSDACDRKTFRVADNPKELRQWVGQLVGHARMVIGMASPIQRAIVRGTITVPTTNRMKPHLGE